MTRAMEKEQKCPNCGRPMRLVDTWDFEQLFDKKFDPTTTPPTGKAYAHISADDAIYCKRRSLERKG